jgi:hypothetical protein
LRDNVAHPANCGEDKEVANSDDEKHERIKVALVDSFTR